MVQNIICPILGTCRRSSSVSYTSSPIIPRPPYGVRITQSRFMRSYRLEPLVQDSSKAPYTRRPSRRVSTDEYNTDDCDAGGSKAKRPVVSIAPNPEQEELKNSDRGSGTQCRRHSIPQIDPIAWFRLHGRRVSEPYQKTYLP